MRASESPFESYKSNQILFFAYLICRSVSGPKVLNNWVCDLPCSISVKSYRNNFGRLDVTPLNIQQLSCVLIGRTVSMSWYKKGIRYLLLYHWRLKSSTVDTIYSGTLQSFFYLGGEMTYPALFGVTLIFLSYEKLLNLFQLRIIKY